MPEHLSYVVAVLVGLFSTTHCIGMCGNIMGAMSLGLPLEIRQRPARLGGFVLAYNLGRLLTYAVLGLAAGAIGGLIATRVDPAAWRLSSGLLAALTLGLVGLYLTGWASWVRQIDRLGSGLWRRVGPFGRRLLPPRGMPSAVLAGMIWGLLPCGLVYYALLLALPVGSATGGALFMLAFGIGTLPGLMTTGMLAGWLARLARRPAMRQLAGASLLGLGLGILVLGQGPWAPAPADGAPATSGERTHHVDR
jgi:sulfite exporter TauE/SafE